MSNILENEEILDELMTSDFNDNLKPDQWKSYLFNFRKYYKTLYSRYKRVSDNLEIKERESLETINRMVKTTDQLKSKILDLEYDNLVNAQKRRLTFKERFTGWINNDI